MLQFHPQGAVGLDIGRAGAPRQRVPSGFVFGWNGTNASVIPKREHPGSCLAWNITRLCVG